ncbi:hypothetical protein [Nonomuraea sp. NPDC050202]|uniref:family 4 glycosyl hydrolase n=1 Tax=Nonomuraea sp. NPDC050202 TaxID=3155035 RepID=UPI0033E25D6D
MGGTTWALAGGGARGPLFIKCAAMPREAMAAYRAYEAGRRSTSMHYPEPGTTTGRERTLGEGRERYAAVVLDLIPALSGGPARHRAANVSGAGRIDALDARDVAEISVAADADGIRPLPCGAVPEPQAGRIRRVKVFQRLPLHAVAVRPRRLAVQALMIHPLILSCLRAAPLAETAHRDLMGVWR